MCIDEITRLDFFKKLKLEQYVDLRVYFKRNLYRSKLYRFYVI